MPQKLVSQQTPELTEPDDEVNPQSTPGDPDAADTTNPGEDDTDEDDEDDPEGAEELGDKGKKALDRMKAKSKQERAENRALKQQLAQLQAAQDAAGKTPDERALDQARSEARAEATEKANQRILRSEIRAAAAGKFRDASDALAFLDLTEFDVDENGDVDQQDINDALADLLERKPHLAAQGGQSSFDSARGKPKPKKKLTRSDLQGMSPAEIDKARREGRIEL